LGKILKALERKELGEALRLKVVFILGPENLLLYLVFSGKGLISGTRSTSFQGKFKDIEGDRGPNVGGNFFEP